MVEAYPGPHANGIVVDSSRFVRIFDDYIDTGDDGIVIKAGKDADGLRVNRPSEDVAIGNCTVHHAHGAVVIGSETSGSIRNVVASKSLPTELKSASASRAVAAAAAMLKMCASTTGPCATWGRESRSPATT